jgi:hypothetical protein
MTGRLLDGIYKSWIRTAGTGWTRRQVLLSLFFSLLFPLIVVAYSFYAHLHWNWIQIVAIALFAWDLSGGAVGYNHASMKARQATESGTIHYFHHNLQHIHPLILIFFAQDWLLLGLTAYWLVTFLLYVELLEVDPATHRRRISGAGERWAVAFESTVAAGLVALAFVVPDAAPGYRVFGIVTYCALPVLTAIVVRTPVESQRTVAIVMLLLVIAASPFLSVPPGFGWIIPVYYLKLLAGFAAKEVTA